jgi:hypothetical protein
MIDAISLTLDNNGNNATNNQSNSTAPLDTNSSILSTPTPATRSQAPRLPMPMPMPATPMLDNSMQQGKYNSFYLWNCMTSISRLGGLAQLIYQQAQEMALLRHEVLQMREKVGSLTDSMVPAVIELKVRISIC